MSILSAMRCAILALVLVGAGVQTASAGGFTPFKGKYTGFLMIAQGTGETAYRNNGNSVVTITGSTKTAKILITGTLNDVAFTQTITLARGKAKLSSVIPGLASFNQKTTGTYKVAGKKITINAPIPSPNSGKLQMTVSYSTFGSLLDVATKLSFAGDGDPAYVSVVGN